MKQHEFEVKSGQMVISDPCYTLPTWCQGVVKVKNGTWIGVPVFLDDLTRVAALIVYNKEVITENPLRLEELKDYMGTELPFNFGVDSGQFGFFDKDLYRNDESVKDLEAAEFGQGYDRKDGDFWYRVVTQQTIAQTKMGYQNFGGIPSGVVASSGYGDGSYPVFGMERDGEYYGFVVVFIDGDGMTETVTPLNETVLTVVEMPYEDEEVE